MRKAFDKVAKKLTHKDKHDYNSEKQSIQNSKPQFYEEDGDNVLQTSASVNSATLPIEEPAQEENTSNPKSRFHSLRFDRLKKVPLIKHVQMLKSSVFKDDKSTRSLDDRREDLSTLELFNDNSKLESASALVPTIEDDQLSVSIEDMPNDINATEQLDQTNHSTTDNKCLSCEINNSQMYKIFHQRTTALESELDHIDSGIKSFKESMEKDSFKNETKLIELEEQIRVISSKMESIQTQLDKYQSTFESVNTYFIQLEEKWGVFVLRSLIPIVLLILYACALFISKFSHRQYVLPILSLFLLYYLKCTLFN